MRPKPKVEITVGDTQVSRTITLDKPEAAAEKGSDTKPPAELKTKDKDSKSGDDKVSDKAKTESLCRKKPVMGDKTVTFL